MFIQTDKDVVLPFGEDIINMTITENNWEWESDTFEIDGTGKLQIINTGGTSASEGGMGSGSESSKEKGDLQGNLQGDKGGTANGDSDTGTGWDPMKKHIEEATAKRDKEDEDE